MTESLTIPCLSMCVLAFLFPFMVLAFADWLES